jgi:hypothetical protein
MKIEKDWITKAGLRAIVIFNQNGQYRCGYVGVEKDSGYYGVENTDIDEYLTVHGGVTFSSHLNGLPENIWWIGYDCAHSGDLVKWTDSWSKGVERSLKYCVKECESLALQLSYIPMKNYFYAINISKGKLPEDMHKQMLLLSLEAPNGCFLKDYFVKSYFQFIGEKV